MFFLPDLILGRNQYCTNSKPELSIANEYPKTYLKISIFYFFKYTEHKRKGILKDAVIFYTYTLI